MRPSKKRAENKEEAEEGEEAEKCEAVLLYR